MESNFQKPRVSKRRNFVLGCLLISLVGLIGVFYQVLGPNAVSLAPITTEVVHRWNSELQIRPNGIISLTELVSAKSEGKELKHGMIRSLPVKYVDEFGHLFSPGYSINWAMRNGVSIPGTSAGPNEDFEQFYLGDEKIELTPGIHEFMSNFEVRNRVRISNEVAYLSWEVTPFWPVPIGVAMTEVRLPPFVEANSIQYSARIVRGDETVQEHPAKAGQIGDGVQASIFDAAAIDPTARDTIGVRFQTTRSLAPFDRLVVTLWWPGAFMKLPVQK